MRNRTRPGWNLTLTCALAFSGALPLRAQVVGKAQEDSKAIKAIVEETVSWYQVFSDASAPEAMAPQRVLRWQNGTRGTQESDGVFVLWAHKGRPEASASIFPYEGSIHHEFVSLSRGANLVARDAGRVIWSPTTPGIAFKVHPDGSPRWQYAFARATSTALEARLDKTVVWAVDVLAGRTTPRDPQLWLYRPLGTTAK